MDFATIPAALTSIKLAREFAQSLLSGKLEVETQQIVIKLQSAILDAQQQCLDAKQELVEAADEISQLKSKIAKLNDQSELISKLVRNDELYSDSSESKEYYCARCIEVDKVIVHVNRTHNIISGHNAFECPQCKTKYLRW